MPFNQGMRSLFAILGLFATLVVVGHPCASRACRSQVQADAGVMLGQAVHAIESGTHAAGEPVRSNADASDVPVAPVSDSDSGTSHTDGGDFDALALPSVPELSVNTALGVRFACGVLPAPALRECETSPRPPRV